MKLLDLFCGAGGAAMGYYRAGYTDITGVDIKPQRHYPFKFIQADAMSFPLEGYDLIHASPPCQAYSITAKLHNKKYLALIPSLRKRLKGYRYVIENVYKSPLINPVQLCGMAFGLKVYRHRWFEVPVYMLAPAHNKHDGETNSHKGYSTHKNGHTGYICVAGHNFNRKEGLAAMGIDWEMNRDETAQAIPPAYTEWIGRRILEFDRVQREDA